MNRAHRLPSTLAILVLLLPLVACGKKKSPTSPANVDPVAAPAPASPAAPAPAIADPIESPLDGDLVAAHEHAYRTGLLGDVLFDFDRSELRADARERLARNARFLGERPEFVVRIEGHCDERGTNEYNLALGERRAQATRDYLLSLGVDGQRLRTISYGEERPACADSDESCWQLNRRAHFVLVERLPGR